MKNPFKLNRTTLRNLPTSWLDAGPVNAPILLFLHGFPDGPSVWEAQATAFQDRFRTILPFNRGLFQSPARKEAERQLERTGITALTLDWLELLREIDPSGKRPVVCIAHDMGVPVAWNLAPLLGSRLKGLITFGGLAVSQMLGRIKNPRQHLKSWYMYAMQVPGLAESLIRVAPKSLLRFAYQQGQLSPEKRPADWDDTDHLRHAFLSYRAFAREIPSQLARRPQKLTCPVLVMWGSDDAFLEPPRLDEFAPLASNVTVRILQGNHWVFREKPTEVNSLIDDFLTELHGFEPSQMAV